MYEPQNQLGDYHKVSSSRYKKTSGSTLFLSYMKPYFIQSQTYDCDCKWLSHWSSTDEL